jgi:hypothetical protein
VIPADPFRISKPLRVDSREGRCQLLHEAANALLAGRLPSSEARLFLAGGLASWLEHDGDLCRDFWRVSPPRGSHRTPARIVMAMKDAAAECADTPDTVREEKQCR